MGNGDHGPAHPAQARRLIVLPVAWRDLADAVAWCRDRFGVRVAERLLARFEEVGALLVQAPGVGTPVARGRRHLPLQRYPYTVVYIVADEVITIVALRHQRRRPRP